ncbi:hypothetical protein JKP88DRAFT_325324 [Tribonema minus]|uniref:Uncharacterized protein n=1 Tax=Tribonema minus TaxID=303371 RepID=A0A835YQZ0_9STRA|nr:hypothetical protein JKP88DRAFT_325324 [Tribonema minus]
MSAAAADDAFGSPATKASSTSPARTEHFLLPGLPGDFQRILQSRPFLDEVFETTLVPSDLAKVQRLLNLALSESPIDQHKAAVELSTLAESRPFAPASFAPLSHALCRLIPGGGRATAAYAARAVKLFALDDAFRELAASSGLPAVLVAALRQWSEEPPCLREVLGALQTLCWEQASARAVVDGGGVEPLLELLRAPGGARAGGAGGGGGDAEMRTLAAAAAANLLAFADTVFLTDEACINAFFDAMEDILEGAVSAHATAALRLHCAAALANGAAHPVLAARLRGLKAAPALRRAAARERGRARKGGAWGAVWGGGRGGGGGRGAGEGGCTLEECADELERHMRGSARGSGEEDLELGLVQHKFGFPWGEGSHLAQLHAPGAARRRAVKQAVAAAWAVSMLLLLRPLLGV